MTKTLPKSIGQESDGAGEDLCLLDSQPVTSLLAF
jgi:hypothetical protein